MKIISDEIQEISLEGFQVVSGELFTNTFTLFDPRATIWNNSISFSKAALAALNGCERVRIEINPGTKGMLLRHKRNAAYSGHKKDKDNVHWVKGVKAPAPRKIECKRFTSQLYKIWDFDPEYVYRTIGRIVTAESKVMLFFDFSKAESWKLSDKARSKKDE